MHLKTKNLLIQEIASSSHERRYWVLRADPEGFDRILIERNSFVNDYRFYVGIVTNCATANAFLPEDIEWSKANRIPLYSYSTLDSTTIEYIPPSYRVNPIGLFFQFGAFDCLETVRIHYRQEKGIYIRDYDRDESFQGADSSIIVDHVRDEGFDYVPGNGPIQVDDVLLFRTNSIYPQHLAVVKEGSQMLHHPIHRLSCVDPINGSWLRRLQGVLRYTKTQ